MFPWGIAKSAEAMFSRFAVRRVCKFLLKKKLGEFILGDIDLDQLDVQLSSGTIQLKDLALNVDRLNDKLGKSAALKVREGSVGSLLVKMPWNCQNCQVEVDELELVLVPSGEDTLHCDSTTCNSVQDGHARDKFEKDNVVRISTSSSIDVHEGVKVVAEMVKWLLANFHVKIKNVIVALDPYLQRDDKKKESLRNAVLRVAEIECGTCFSGDNNSSSGAKIGDFLSIDLLTNFLTFQGAIVELLLVDDTENQRSGPSAQCPKTTPILTGGHGGFSGNVNLSIPWKNGSLDICKMNVGVSLDPVEVKLQPWIIKWFLLFWQTLESYEKNDRAVHETADFVVSRLTSPKSGQITDDIVLSSLGYSFYSSASGSDAMVDDKFTHNLYTHLGEDIDSDMILENSHLISDWMPCSVGRSQDDSIGEANLGASVDQFFECFDGMRNSQSMLGSSGMWNWTCSVFSAITAASSLASGSLCIPTEQQHVETNVKVTLAEVSMVLFFLDEDHMVIHGPSIDQIHIDSEICYLKSRLQDVLVVMQASPQEYKVEAIVKHIDLTDYFSGDNNVSDAKLNRFSNNVNTETLLIQKLQDEVMSALPSSSFYPKDSTSQTPYIASVEVPFGFLSVQHYASGLRCENKETVKARMLTTYGSTEFQFAVSSKSSDGCFTGPAVFRIDLPPFVFWANLNFLEKLLDLLDKTQAFRINNAENSGLSEDFKREPMASAHSDVTGSLHGNILLPTARIIVCFPFKKGESCGCYASWDQLVAFDFSSASNFKMEQAQCAAGTQGSSRKKYSASASRSLCVNVAKVDIYLISTDSEGDGTDTTDNLEWRSFSTDRVLSLSNMANHSTISLLWHGDAVTGAWVVKNAKLLASSDNLGSKTRIAKKDYEFSYATTRRHKEDLSFLTKREMILTSEFLLHVSLCPVEVTLGNRHLICLYQLLNEVMAVLVHRDEKLAYKSKGALEGQVSVLVECDSIVVSINLDAVDCDTSSLQRELPGAWHNFKLNVQSFEYLSVYNLGGIGGAIFYWMSHGEGSLWGSITGLPDEELLLLLCSNSAMGRGDGEGSNQLSCRPAGSDIVHLFDPESLHNFTSTTLKCSTIVAPGARLDWLDKIYSFFSLQSTNSEEAAANSLLKDRSQDSISHSSSFLFSLIDGSLSYEPQLRKSIVSHESSTLESTCSGVEKENCEPLVASLLAASLLKLSSATEAGTSECHYNIRMQDLGLLLHVVSMAKKTDYSAEHLREIGYVKVAMESLVQAVLRNNRESDHWELDCSNSHITVSTCHDTTLGLMRFFSQIQQLFAPDVEESALHLQNRWNSVQQVQEKKFNGESRANPGVSPSGSVIKQVDPGAASDGVIGLMNEIHEDAFVGNYGGPFDGCESEEMTPLRGREQVDDLICSSKYPGEVPMVIGQSFEVTGLEGQTALVLQRAELIDSYCLSELRSLSGLTLSNQFPDAMLKSRSMNVGNQDVCRENGVWYGNRPLQLMEEHISDTNVWTIPKKLVERSHPSGNHRKSHDCDGHKGRVLLNNLNVNWKMYAGSDWQKLGQAARHSADFHGRDGAVCLELSLSDMNIQYDVFPDGDICVSRLYLSVKDFYVHDRSRHAPWKLVLGYYHSKKHPRESSSNAFKLDLEAIRPNPSTPLEEYRLQIAILPLSLHLHQRQLDFLTAFFLGNLSSVDVSDPSNMLSTRHYGSENLVIEEALLPFFQKFDMWPVTLRVDYQPTQVDLAALSGGKYVELVNLVSWKGVELKLKHVHATGIYGWKSISETMFGEWLEDISQNQIHKLLKGLPTIQSLVSVGSVAAKLVSLPVKNYRKNHRLTKGVQTGTIAFLRSISVEALGLGVHLAAGAHDILLHAESIISRIQPSLPSPIGSEMKTVIGSDQPRDALHGLQQAYENLSDGLGRSASALVHTPMKTYQRGGSSAAFVSAIRGAPAAAIAPASAAAHAVHSTLLGVRNSLDPEHESLSKYSSCEQN
ncbi:hypothetical protein Dimus_029008 [Dionaea muscipula]